MKLKNKKHVWSKKDGFEVKYQIQSGSSKIIFLLKDSLKDKLKVDVELVEPGAKVDIAGIFIGRDSFDLPWDMTVSHQSKETQASILVKGILSDRACANFSGMIKIAKNAQQVESYLSHHTLLLSDQAQVHVVPSLEIEANHVKASHASTTHYLDEEQMFYLTNRGIDAKQAQKILVKAFLSEVKI